jgi:hypothetical protein
MPDESGGTLDWVKKAWQAQADVRLMMRVRRVLVSRADDPALANYTGTGIPAPFNTTSLALKTMIDAPASAAQHYASRIAANIPDIQVTPITARDDVSRQIDRTAGDQERCDAALWESMGGRDQQWRMGWAMSLGGVGYYLTLPRDADWGLPQRQMYTEVTDDEIARLQREGQATLARVPGPKGQMVYAERGDVWKARRRDKMKKRAEDGVSLFTLRALPRDMVVVEKDGDGIKRAAVVEEIPGDAVAPGSAIARSRARKAGTPEDDVDLYGIYVDDKGQIVGGVSRGGPDASNWNRPDIVTVIREFDRTMQRIYIAPRGSVETAFMVYEGEHGCTIQGTPANPIEEVPFFRTDVDVPRLAYSTPIDRIFAYTPLINQIETLRSNATAFNLIPRWVVELKDGSILRGEDGEPKIVDSGQVPGLNPNEAAAYPGTLRQLTIQTADTDELLKIYLEQLAQAMPSPVTQGAGGTSGAAWTAQTLIQQAQETLRQPVDNHAGAVKRILQRCHGWSRELDMPIYFFAAPRFRKNKRNLRGSIEFDPKDFTDAIYVTQELDTPEERTVRIQVGMQLWEAGAIDDVTFYEDYMRTPDARQAVIDRYVQIIADYVMYGKVPPTANPQIFPQSLVVQIADGVRGQVHYELVQTSPNYALKVARDMAQQTQMGQQGMGQPGTTNVAEAAGIRRPGMGMAPTLQQQLGANAPGATAMPVMGGVS